MFKKKNKIEKFPTHIAFIMDGNRRWAVRRGLNKMIGHKQGGLALKNIISVLAEYEEIKYASFFAFSTENWNRSAEEIDYIFDIAYNLVKDNEKAFVKKISNLFQWVMYLNFQKNSEKLLSGLWMKPKITLDLW